METWQLIVATIAVIAAILIVVLAATRVVAWVARDKFCGPGPYNMGLYDSPRYYPHYEAPAFVGWDVGRRCAAYCGGPGGCTVACR